MFKVGSKVINCGKRGVVIYDNPEHNIVNYRGYNLVSFDRSGWPSSDRSLMPSDLRGRQEWRNLLWVHPRYLEPDFDDDIDYEMDA